MNISDFYTHVLGANRYHHVWSWGAHDPLTNRLYLQVWADQIVRREAGEYVIVRRERPGYRSGGIAERERHLAMLQDGAETFGVVCTAKDPSNDRERKIKSFEEEELLRLGPLEAEGTDTYARIIGRVPVTAIKRPPTSESTLTADVLALGRKKGDPTTKEAMVSARVGQGAFRVAVLTAWGERCAVTGAKIVDAIRASHIKPWRDSTDEERLDASNGLPLVANLDALFDAGLISFDSSGVVLLSPLLDGEDRAVLGLAGLALRAKPSAQTEAYLAYHRAEILRA